MDATRRGGRLQLYKLLPSPLGTAIFKSLMKKYKDSNWLREQYTEKDRTQTNIASECGVSDTTIQHWRDKFDIEEQETAQFGTQTDGYEQWKCEVGPGKADTVTVHRLLATLQVDELDELEGKHVHHQSGIPWDNRLENLEVVSPQEHAEIHTHAGRPSAALGESPDSRCGESRNVEVVERT
jgi:hypothetical protein